MTFLPIVERELRVRARQRATYWTRFAAVLLGLLIGLPQLALAGAFSSPAQTGRAMFNALIVVAFIGCLVACLTTADVISSERREGTLGLLFLTRVKGRDIVLGKLCSAGLASLCALAAFLPLLMLPVLAGGVTGGEAWRKGLALVNLLSVALAVGLCVSAGGREWFKSARYAVLILLAVLLVPAMIGVLSQRASGRGLFLGLPSPLMTLLAAGDAAYKRSAEYYWLSLVMAQAVCWLFVWGAGWRLRRSVREGTETAGTQVQPAPGTALASETAVPSVQAVLPRGRGHRFGEGDSPVEWLVGQQHGLKAMIWTAVILQLAQLMVPLRAYFSPSTFLFSVAFIWPVSVAIAMARGALLAWAASRFFVQARKSGQLELLRTTPWGAKTIVSGQWQALKRALCWPVVVMLVIYLLPTVIRLMPVARGTASANLASWSAYSLVSLTVAAAGLVLDVVAVCGVGLWFGLVARGQGAAILWTIGLVKGVPLLIGLIYSTILSLSYRLAGSGLFAVYLLNVGLQLAIVVYLLWLIQFARRRLSRALEGGEAAGSGLGLMAGQARAAIGRLRHWTPST